MHIFVFVLIRENIACYMKQLKCAYLVTITLAAQIATQVVKRLSLTSLVAHYCQSLYVPVSIA